MVPNILSIAGFDPGGGAGVLADMKTFAALRCHGLAAVTALTVQNTQGVADVHVVPAEFVAAQVDALFDDIDIAAVKIGLLASTAIVEAVAQSLAKYRTTALVLDPVLAATSGDPLAVGDIAGAMLRHLAPLVTLVTPNLAEAASLADGPMPTTLAGMHRLTEELHQRGFEAVLVTGGHLDGTEVTDVLFDGHSHHTFAAPRIATHNTHGTGCTFSAAIAAELALGLDLIPAIRAAKAYVTQALAAADELDVGHGPGPLNHFYQFW
jgi:hydroxymethylpyrimidine/phosphomethylpyrimidine kinase